LIKGEIRKWTKKEEDSCVLIAKAVELAVGTKRRMRSSFRQVVDVFMECCAVLIVLAPVLGL